MASCKRINSVELPKKFADCNIYNFGLWTWSSYVKVKIADQRIIWLTGNISPEIKIVSVSFTKPQLCIHKVENMEEVSSIKLHLIKTRTGPGHLQMNEKCRIQCFDYFPLKFILFFLKVFFDIFNDILPHYVNE